MSASPNAATAGGRLAPPPASSAPTLPAVLATAATAGGVAVLAWWWANTDSLHGFGDWLTAGGRVSGLLSGYLLALVLLLMARIPLLEQRIGADRLARWHARAGRYAIGLLVAHTLLIIWGYAVSAHTNVVHQTGTLLTSYPDVLMATVGMGLLVGAGITSAQAARRRLRYETWYYLHLYSYLALALAFAHSFANGAEFATHPLARLAWAALYVVAAAAVVGYRFAWPIYQTLRQRMRVVRVEPAGPAAVSIVLRGNAVEELHARPGQFVRLRFLTPRHWWASHPFSLSAEPAGDLLRVTVKQLGDHTATMPFLRPGTPVLVEGPYGALTAERRRQRKVLLLAGGIGITPLRALFQTLPAEPGELTLVYRADRPEDVVLRDELDVLAHRRQQRVHYLFGPPGSPGDVLVGGRLLRLLPDLLAHDVYVCGPPGFVAAADAALRQLGVPAQQIHSENFAL